MNYKTCDHAYCQEPALWHITYDGSSNDACDAHAAEVKASGKFGTITRNGQARPDPVDLTVNNRPYVCPECGKASHHRFTCIGMSGRSHGATQVMVAS